jgi:hypothetical protein
MIREVNLAFYRESDWNQLLASIDDKGSMHDAWKDWKDSYYRTKKKLIKEGFIVNEVTIDIDKLNQFCRDNGVQNTGKVRSQYVSQQSPRK